MAALTALFSPEMPISSREDRMRISPSRRTSCVTRVRIGVPDGFFDASYPA